MVEFLHSYLSHPYLILKDIILQALNILTSAIKEAPPATFNAQLQYIIKMQQLLHQWRSPEDTNPSPTPIPIPCKAPTPRGPIYIRACAQDTPTRTLPMSNTTRPPHKSTPKPRCDTAPRVHKATSKGVPSHPIFQQTRSHELTPSPTPTPDPTPTPSVAIPSPLEAPVAH